MKVTSLELRPGGELSYAMTAVAAEQVAPGIEAYDVGTVVEFQATAAGVKLVVTVDAMHDEVWTERARAGNESQLRKLDALLGTH